MIAGAPRTRAQMEAAHAAASAAGAERPLPPANADAVRALRHPDVLYFRGRRLRLRPVPYLVGQSLLLAAFGLEMMEHVELPPHAQLREHRRRVAVVLDVLHECARPPGWRSLFWRWRRNPFADASEGEIWGLISFFDHARTRSRVGSRPGRAPEDDSLST